MNFRNSEFLPRGFLYPFFVNRCSWGYYNSLSSLCQWQKRYLIHFV
uniref:Uncharacterized protein n=1 Tax=Siphoviridae sp. ct3pR10 TaxID=2826284 RepID=A0A8S5LWL4_9CAUD|nr:MAG TPA: hypothetical protein [Siphoviridae sp. ct3pR10]